MSHPYTDTEPTTYEDLEERGATSLNVELDDDMLYLWTENKRPGWRGTSLPVDEVSRLARDLTAWVAEHTEGNPG